MFAFSIKYHKKELLHLLYTFLILPQQQQQQKKKAQ